MNTPHTRCPVCGGGLTAAGFCARCVLAGTDPLPPKDLSEVDPDAHYEPRTAVRYFGHFQLLDEGREGGMGVVYHARQLNLKREVALKMILGHCLRSADLVRRFRREVEVLARLDHPNVLPILEVGEQHGQHYYCMKWVAEGSLADQFERWRFPGPGEVKERQRRLVELLLGIVRGVQHAHQRGILHRDLKPANVLVDAAGQPYVADFGLAKWAEDEEGGKTQTRAGLGSPAYMSPEQAVGGERELTTAADVWALGVIFYELLTGRRPFVGSNNAEMLKRVLEVEPEAPRRADPRIDRDLETICQKCLEKEAGRRYASAEALGKELERWLAGEPIEARPVTGLERLGKWARRRPVVAAWIGATALALVIVLAHSVWSQRAKSVSQQRMRLDAANTAFAEDRAHEGVAMLVSLLEDHPKNQAALIRLQSVLLYRNWPTSVTLYLRHGGEILSADFSLDGRRVATASADGTARIWDLKTGEDLTPVLEHDGPVRTVQFSPDGTRLLTVSSDPNDDWSGTARLWDVETGEVLVEFLQNDRLRFAEFSADGQYVVTSSYNHARVWSARTAEPLSPELDLRSPRYVGQRDWRVYGPRFAARLDPWGENIALLMDNRLLQMRNAHTGSLTLEVDAAEALDEVALCFDSRLLAARVGRGVRVWDLDRAVMVSGPMEHDPDDSIHLIQLSPDGTRLLTISRDAARLWDPRSGHPILEALRVDGANSSGSFSRDGSRLVIAASDGTARIYHSWDGQPVGERLEHGGPITHASFSHDGSRLITGCSQGAARVWSITDSAALPLAISHGLTNRAAQFSADGTRVVTVSADGAARIWDPRTGRVLAGPLHHESNAYDAQFSADGTLLVTFCVDGIARIWDAEKGGALFEPWWPEHEGFLLALTPDHSRVAMMNRRGQILVWKESRWTPPLVLPFQGLGSGRVSAEFSGDGKRLVVTDFWGGVNVYDIEEGRLVFFTNLLNYLWNVRWSPDGATLLAAPGRSEAWLLDARTSLTQARLGSSGSIVWAAAFSPDNARVLTACASGIISLWNRESGCLVAEYGHRGHAVMAVAYDNSGERVLVTYMPNAQSSRRSDYYHRNDVFETLDLEKIGAFPVHIFDLPARAADLPAIRKYATYLAGRIVTQAGLVVRLSPEQYSDLEAQLEALQRGKLRNPALAWLLADRSTRPISPYANRTMTEHVSLVVEQGTRLEVELALGYVPMHQGLLMRLATLTPEEDEAEDDPSLLNRAVFLARLAAQQDPENVAVQIGYLRVLVDLERYDATALAESSRLLGRFPENRQIAALRLRLLVGAQEWEGALDAITGLTKLVEDGVSLDLGDWRQILEDHTTVLRALGREQEIEDARAFWLSKRLPPRPISAGASQIDLSTFYNAAFEDDWHNAADVGNNLASLQLDLAADALLQLGGVAFDARGIVQLSSTAIRQFDPNYPERVSSIPVGAPVRRIHFLHGLGWPEVGGAEIARYLVRYADGAEAEVPVVYGEQIRNWQFWPEGVAAEAGGAEPVWKGPQARWQEHWPEWGVRLYQLTWTNPRPEVTVQSFNFVSTMTRSAPFLVAVTVE